MRGLNLLGQKATALTAPNRFYGEGKVIAYCDAPQVCIRREDGSKFWWRVDLCRFQLPTEHHSLTHPLLALAEGGQDLSAATTLTLLRCIEWSAQGQRYDYGDFGKACPVCGGCPPLNDEDDDLRGHSDGCELAALIQAYEIAAGQR